jgi:hypothetical protein
MGPIRGPKTSLQNYHSTLRNVPEQRRSQLSDKFSFRDELLSKQLNKAQMLSIVLYDYKMWSLTSLEGHKVQILANEMLSDIHT